MNPKHSPWGEVQNSYEIAPGIISVSTASHGGILLSPERYTKMPACFQATFAGPRAYEEDCDYAMVVAVFPEHFSIEAVSSALRSIRQFQ